MAVYIGFMIGHGGVSRIEKHASRDAFWKELCAWAKSQGIPEPKPYGFAYLFTWATDNRFRIGGEESVFVSPISSDVTRILVKEEVATLHDFT